MWTLSQPKTVVVPWILRHFVASDVYDTMCELALSANLEKPGSHRNTAEGSAGEPYAGELYDMIVPLATLCTKGEVSISARLGSLEAGMKKLTDSVSNALHGGARHKGSALTVTACSSCSDSSCTSRSTGWTGRGTTWPTPTYIAKRTCSSFADVAGMGGDVDGRAQGQGRTRFGSQKRIRNDNEENKFQEVQNRRRQPVNHGSSQVEVEDEGVAAPVEFYIGNTTPAATEEIVKNFLIKCAKGIESNTEFKVVEVVHLAKQE